MQPTPQIQERDLGVTQDRNPAVRVTPGAPEPDEVLQSRGGATPETPQYVASMHLVNTAKSALQQGNAEQAIAQLEQAIQVDAYNAEAFFVLAQAWQSSGDTKRALEFARKAEILYQDEPQALKRVYLLEADLLKRNGQKSEAEIYRQKAARLDM
jgi:tetratricopeptide (TPR) repeat protein